MIVTAWAAIFLGLAVVCLGMSIACWRDHGTSMVWAMAACVFGALGAFVGFRG